MQNRHPFIYNDNYDDNVEDIRYRDKKGTRKAKLLEEIYN